LTSTCPAPGFGSGMVSATIRPLRKMAARIFALPSRFCLFLSHRSARKESGK
jgi:hypothetical protein